MKVVLPYPPSVNRIWRRGVGGITYQPTEVKNYKKMCAWLARQAGATLINGEIEIIAILHPKLTKKGKASNTRIDLDNLTKTVLDSLNGVCYIDDKQVTKITLEVGYPIENGGVTIEAKRRDNEIW